MKQLFVFVFFLALLSCSDSTQQTDNEKESSEAKLEIKTDSGEVKTSSEGLSVAGKDGDSVNIKINAEDGIKVEGKDGKVELKTDAGGKIKLEKKGKEVNIQIKEN